MSTSGDPVRVVQQFRLGGGISVLEFHGEGGRTRVNAIRCETAREAGAVVRGAQALQHAELIAAIEGDLERPCPRCGLTGSAEHSFGFRFLRGRRVRQSWCRRCRAS